MVIELISQVMRTEGIMTAPVDKEIVLLNMQGNNYISLDEIGCRIWELLEKPVSVQELCARLGTEFEGTQEQICTDVLLFLTELESEGLVRVVG